MKRAARTRLATAGHPGLEPGITDFGGRGLNPVWPVPRGGTNRNREVRACSGLLDATQTILEIATGSIDSALDGRSLLPTPPSKVMGTRLVCSPILIRFSAETVPWRRVRDPRRERRSVTDAPPLPPSRTYNRLSRGRGVIGCIGAFQAPGAGSNPVARLAVGLAAYIGAWRSLVAHPAGGGKAAGSNPVAPIFPC